jgi:hypothetical protein
MMPVSYFWVEMFVSLSQHPDPDLVVFTVLSLDSEENVFLCKERFDDQFDILMTFSQTCLQLFCTIDFQVWEFDFDIM